jgi:hypothetical protein
MSETVVCWIVQQCACSGRPHVTLGSPRRVWLRHYHQNCSALLQSKVARLRYQQKRRRGWRRGRINSTYYWIYSEIPLLRSVRRLLVTANVVPSTPILVTLMMEAPSTSETLVLIRATRRNIPEDAILHSHSRENLKSYIALTGWTL